MALSRKEIWQLGAVVAVAVLLSSLIRAHKSLGENVGNNSLVLAIRQDRTSPSDINPRQTLHLFFSLIIAAPPAALLIPR